MHVCECVHASGWCVRACMVCFCAQCPCVHYVGVCAPCLCMYVCVCAVWVCGSVCVHVCALPSPPWPADVCALCRVCARPPMRVSLTVLPLPAADRSPVLRLCSAQALRGRRSGTAVFGRGAGFPRGQVQNFHPDLPHLYQFPTVHLPRPWPCQAENVGSGRPIPRSGSQSSTGAFPPSSPRTARLTRPGLPALLNAEISS